MMVSSITVLSPSPYLKAETAFPASIALLSLRVREEKKFSVNNDLTLFKIGNE